MTVRTHWLLTVLAVMLLLGGCNLRLADPYVPAIEEGLPPYQKALETFVLTTRDHYQACRDGKAEACQAASYAASKQSFYVPQEAALLVLETKAQVIDSLGLCKIAYEAIAELAQTTISDPALSQEVDKIKSAKALPGNCTEVQIDTILKNQALMAETHQALDRMAPERAAAQVLDHDALGTFRDTLVQNIKIALFLENAKKRQ